jgi:hypothetical protein
MSTDNPPICPTCKMAISTLDVKIPEEVLDKWKVRIEKI